LTVELNAKKFVEWLLRLPPKKLIRPMQASEAVAVARRLAELADSQPEFWALASDICALLLRVADGKIATNAQCERFLRDYAPYFSNHNLTAALAAIKKTTDVPTPRMARNPNQIEYRIERPVAFAPAAVYGPRTSRRPPADDVSERIGVAIDAMTEAKCRRPAAVVADSLRTFGILPKEYCTISHVTSRSKSLGPRTPLLHQETPAWLMSYWRTLDPEHSSKSAADPEWPERFVFKQCDC
jgi:hypothetical protein